MEKYLYLNKLEHADSWIYGGKIPIPKLASSYKRLERDGIYTPDEAQINSSTIDLGSHPVPKAFGLKEFRGSTFAFNSYGGKAVPNIIEENYYFEDGLIMCFSNSHSRERGIKLKKKVCLKIRYMEYLKDLLDDQIGIKGIKGTCNYTMDFKRDHFLKSIADNWQDEYRIFWPSTKCKAKRIVLPPQIAELVEKF